VWVYDLRANMPQFGKRTPLTREHFAEFEAAFGEDPLGHSPQPRKAPGHRRNRPLPPLHPRVDRRARDDSLDLSWLKDDSAENHDDLPEPATLAREAITELEGAFDELRGILAELGSKMLRRWAREPALRAPPSVLTSGVARMLC
jgi:type I restriction enzyme M protein